MSMLWRLPSVLLLALVCGDPTTADPVFNDGVAECSGTCSQDPDDAASLLAHSRASVRPPAAAAPIAAAANGPAPHGGALKTETISAAEAAAKKPERTLTEDHPEKVEHVAPDYHHRRILLMALSVVVVALAVYFFFGGYTWERLSNPESILCFALCGMLIFGSANVLAKDALVVHNFYNPFMWNCVTMIGQTMCMPLYWISKMSAGQEAPKESEKGMAPFSVLLQVTLIDLTALSLINLTYNVLPGSLIQMLRGAKVAFTCLLSKWILGASFDYPKLIGMGMNFAGLLFIVISSRDSMWGDSDDQNQKSKVTLALCIGGISQLVGSFQFIYEKKVMESYDVPPLLLAGLEGLIGAPVGLLVLILANVVGLEDSVAAIAQIESSQAISSLMILFLFAVATFNLSGISVTKHGSPVLRALMEIMRTACIWTLEVARGWLSFSYTELIAYLLTSVGTLIYGKQIPLPCLPASK